jgi:hypothetical protein
MTTVFNESRLTTVPRPAIPELSRPLTPAELEEALRGFHGSYYVEHPFHKLMYQGKLHAAPIPGLGRQPARVPARRPARRDPVQLS